MDTFLDSPQLFINYQDPSPDFIKEIVNGYTSKPRIGGLWTSSYVCQTSEWVRTAVEVGYAREPKDMNWYLMYPRNDVRVYHVDCVSDCMKLYDKFGLANPDFFNDKIMSVLDFQSIKNEYDAIHLTKNGQLETLDRLAYPNLAGWDCESTIWFRWCFEKFEKIYDAYDRNQKEKEQQRKKKKDRDLEYQ